MFASGWHSIGAGGGGRLLCSSVPPGAILAEPSAHSRRLGEYEFTVDPALVLSVEVLASYPQID